MLNWKRHMAVFQLTEKKHNQVFEGILIDNVKKIQTLSTFSSGEYQYICLAVFWDGELLPEQSRLGSWTPKQVSICSAGSRDVKTGHVTRVKTANFFTSSVNVSSSKNYFNKMEESKTKLNKMNVLRPLWCSTWLNLTLTIILVF